MIWLLLGLHVLGIAVLAGAGNALGRRSLLVATIPTFATTAWAITRFGTEEPTETSVSWAEGLDLELAFRVDDLGVIMTLLVSGIGTLIFVYAHGYFSSAASGVGRFSTTLLSFSTAMLGLVWSDGAWTFFLFWELTSITSFLLVGHRNTDASVRAAARRALVLTVSGGLAMLAGMVILIDATGTTRISEMSPVTGTSATVVAVLLLVAAATKSAQVPFHMWLPGAMAAPTPVSAYLHSATMVKAGVLLVAIGGPILGEVATWRTLGLVFGLTSMLWGAIGALRHLDAKLILAWGTISQLGLMVSLLSIGEPKATFAGVSILLAHALFKAALFMVVGEIDVRTGTRRIDELSGLARSMPLAAVVAIVSGASMAGVPPFLGFAAKEAAIEAAIKLKGTELIVIGGLIILGSTLTVAYTVRLLLGLFGPSEVRAGDNGVAHPDRSIDRTRLSAMGLSSAVLALFTFGGFVAIELANELVIPAAGRLDVEAAGFELYRWPGLTTGLAISTAVVGGGAVLGWLLARRQGAIPATVGADAVDRMIDQLIEGAQRLTGRIQHGSLPVYMVTMGAVAAVVTLPFVRSVDVDTLYLWDRPAQGVLAVIVVGASVIAVILQTRLAAALSLGAVGIGVSGLFFVHGAPDLVLTQLLVETVIVIGFVIGLGHLTRRFPASGRQWRLVRLTVSVAAALGITAALAASAAAPTGSPPLQALTDEAVDIGGGNNVVNVILTDIRGLDTLGEVVVLAVAAIGIVALAAAARNDESQLEGEMRS